METKHHFKNYPICLVLVRIFAKIRSIALVANQLAMAKALQETLSVACEMSNKLDGMNKGYTGSDMVNDIFGGAKR